MILKGEIQIGGSINVRTEKHGDENVSAMDIPCAMLIKRKELNQLMREETTDALLFKSQNEGHYEPVFGGKIGPIPVLGKFKKSKVALKCGVNEQEITFEDCVLSKLKIDPQIGGMTLLKFTVQAKLTDDTNPIFHFANSSQPGQVNTGKFQEEKADDQPELPLGENPPGDQVPLGGGILPEITDDEAAGIAQAAALENSKPAKAKRVRPSRAKGKKK